jgi:hypothetical protein
VVPSVWKVICDDDVTMHAKPTACETRGGMRSKLVKVGCVDRMNVKQGGMREDEMKEEGRGGHNQETYTSRLLGGDSEC